MNDIQHACVDVVIGRAPDLDVRPLPASISFDLAVTDFPYQIPPRLKSRAKSNARSTIEFNITNQLPIQLTLY
jgi:hypothetical protein